MYILFTSINSTPQEQVLHAVNAFLFIAASMHAATGYGTHLLQQL